MKAAAALRCLPMAVLVAPGAGLAQLVEGVPEELAGVGITERLGEALPLEATFVDEDGRAIALGSFFETGRPVVVNLVYFDCPMLCNVFLDGFVATLSELDWTPGDEFEVVTVSIDPTDTAEGATDKRDHYVGRLDRPHAAAGWHFLTGTESNVRKLAEAIGFAYRYDDERREYMHSAGLFLATPDGHLSRYLYGVAFDPRTFRLSLVEASEGGVGSTMDRALLFCFAYDHAAGRYGPAAFKIMRAGAALTVVVLGAFLLRLGRRERRPKNAVLGTPT